jgi:hypothetical protein
MARIVRFHQYGDPSVLKIEDLDVPPPAADEVQIEVKSIGLNRAEVMFRTHAYLQEAQFPSRLGYEAAQFGTFVNPRMATLTRGSSRWKRTPGTAPADHWPIRFEDSVTGNSVTQRHASLKLGPWKRLIRH